MRRLLTATSAAAVLVALLAIPVGTVQACTCMMRPIEQRIADADLAVVGTVTAAIQTGMFPGENIRHRLRVELANRPVPAVLEFDTRANDGSCGTGQYQIGLNGLFIFDQVGGHLETMLCHGNTASADLVPRDQAVLQEMLTVRPGPVPADEGADASEDVESLLDGRSLLPWIAIILVAGALVAAGAWSFRGSNRPRR